MKHASLFSGIGGFDLAAEWMGWENIFHCEWNPFGQKVLNYYWPKSISYGDITKTDFTIHRGTIDILTGGFPCQPYSVAGKRLGKEDERHLWPEMLRAIREVQPSWVVGENVGGIISWNGGLVFNEVQTDLEAEGYEILPFLLPAASVNAPHKRDRVWFVAHSNDKRGSAGLGEIQKENGEVPKRNEDAKFGNTNARHFTNSLSARQPRWEVKKRVREQGYNGVDRLSSAWITANTEGKQSEWVRSEQRENSQQEQGQFGGSGCEMGNRNVADTGCGKWKNRIYGNKQEWKTEELGNGNTKYNTWENFPTTEPTIRSGNDGFSDRLVGITFSKWRNESIKAYGNAIVPQVVFKIFKAIEEYNNLAK